MEPERRESHTHIERDRERRSGSGMAFVVGGLVVAVLVLTAVLWGGGWGGRDDDVEISTQTEVPGVLTETPAEGGAEIEAVEPEPEARPEIEAEPEAAPVAPAR